MFNVCAEAVETEPFDTSAFTAKCEAHVAESKSLVDTNPSHALSPTVQKLLDTIATTPM